MHSLKAFSSVIIILSLETFKVTKDQDAIIFTMFWLRSLMSGGVNDSQHDDAIKNSQDRSGFAFDAYGNKNPFSSWIPDRTYNERFSVSGKSSSVTLSPCVWAHGQIYRLPPAINAND